MLQNGNVHILLVLISEKRLNGFLAVAKINFLQELILQVRVCRANSEGKHDKTRMIYTKKEDFCPPEIF
jgi:hypothetical protein